MEGESAVGSFLDGNLPDSIEDWPNSSNLVVEKQGVDVIPENSTKELEHFRRVYIVR